MPDQGEVFGDSASSKLGYPKWQHFLCLLASQDQVPAKMHTEVHTQATSCQLKIAYLSSRLCQCTQKHKSTKAQNRNATERHVAGN